MSFPSLRLSRFFSPLLLILLALPLLAASRMGDEKARRPALAETARADALAVAPKEAAAFKVEAQIDVKPPAIEAAPAVDDEKRRATVRDALLKSASAGALTAEMTDTFTDPGTDGAEPGQTVSYSVVIDNQSGATVAGADFAITLDPNAPLVAGTVKTTPLARDDAVSALGNVNLSIPVTALISNDTDADDAVRDNDGVVVTSIDDTGTSGSVSLDNKGNGDPSDDTVEYNPSAGFTGTDTFTYTITENDAEAGTSTATVSVTVTTLIWFIDNSASGGSNDGRLTSPFETLAAFESVNGSGGANPAAGQNIFIYETGTDYNGPLTLENTQVLVGEGAGTAGDNLDDVLGLTVPTHSAALPAVGGTNPAIVNATGTGINLASGNTIRGLDIGTTSGAGLAGSGFGTLTINQVSVNGTGPGLDLDNGTFAATSSFGTLSTTSTTAANGIDLNTVGGSFTVTTTSLSGVSGTGISIQSAPASTSFDFGTTTVGSTSTGIDLATTNNGTSTFTFDDLSITTSAGTGLAAKAGTVNVSGTSGTVGATGGPALDLANVTVGNGSGGAMTFASLTSTTSTSDGINLNTVAGSLTVTGTTTIDNSTADGIDISSSSATFTFASVDIDGTASAGVLLTNNTGAVSINGGTIGATNDPAGIAVDIDQGAANVTVAAAITNQTNRAVEVTNRSGGTVAFTGFINEDGTGINLGTNGAGSVNFSGGMDLDTGSNTAFNATGSGTVNVCATNPCGGGTGVVNRIGNNTAVNRTGINITDVTIGGNGVTFQSIDVNGVGASTVSGIILDDTGAGTFTVSGTGTTDGSGGTLENILADAVSLSNTDGRVSFVNMIIEDIGNMGTAASGHDAIHGQLVDGGLTLDNTTIRRISDNALNGTTFGASGPALFTSFVGLDILNSLIEDTNRYHVGSTGDSNNEGMVRIRGLSGTVNVDDSIFRRGAELLDLDTAASGTLTMTVTDNEFRDSFKGLSSSTAAGLSCIQINVDGSLAADIVIGNENETTQPTSGTALPATPGNFFNGCATTAIEIAHNDEAATGQIDAVVSGNTIDNVTGRPGWPGGFGGPFGLGNWPQSSVLLRGRGTTAAVFNAIFSKNYMKETGQSGTNTGTLTLFSDGITGGGAVQAGTMAARVSDNTFDTPFVGGFFVNAENNVAANVWFDDNEIIGGTPSHPDFGPTPSPGNSSEVQAVESGRVHATVTNHGRGTNNTSNSPGFPEHDQIFGIAGPSFHASMRTGSVELCLSMSENTSDRGYRLRHEAGTFLLHQGVSASVVPQTILQNNNNTGGLTAGVKDPTKTPPDVSVTGGIANPTATATACTTPSGGIFAAVAPEAGTDTAPLAATEEARTEDATLAAALPAPTPLPAVTASATAPDLHAEAISALGEGTPSPAAPQILQEAPRAEAALSRAATVQPVALAAPNESDETAPVLLASAAPVDRAALLHARRTRAAAVPPVKQAPAVADIDLTLGDLPNGAAVTVTFDVQVKSDIVKGVPVISNQGTVTGDAGGTVVQTDDPAVGGAADPTVTPLNNPAGLVINEVDYDQGVTDTADDTAEFIEIKNVGGSQCDDLSNFALKLIDGTGTPYGSVIQLPATALADGDYFVVCANAANVANCDLDTTPDADLLQNGAPDAVALVLFADPNVILDVVSYEGNTAAPFVEGTGVAVAKADDPSSEVNTGLSRIPDGSDTDDNDTDFQLRCITPGATNAATSTDCVPDLSIEKSDDADPVQAGSTITYTLAIANNGTQDAHDVTLTETVPTNATTNGLTNTGWVVQGTATACDNQAAGTICEYAYGFLAAAANDTVPFKVKVDSPLAGGVDKISNTASLADASMLDLTPGDNTDTEDTYIGFAVTASVFLEGPFDDTAGTPSMKTGYVDEGVMVAGQPYGGATFTGTYLEYNGTESVPTMGFFTSGVGATVVEWIQLILVSGDPPTGAAAKAAPLAEVARRAVLLLADGTTYDPLTGSNQVVFNVPTGDYRLVFAQGNHLPAMTNAAQTVQAAPVADFDLRSSETAAYPGTVGPKAVAPLTGPGCSSDCFGLWAGNAALFDGSLAERIQPDDGAIFQAQLLSPGGTPPAYGNQGDFDLNGRIQPSDGALWQMNFLGGIKSRVPLF